MNFDLYYRLYIYIIEESTVYNLEGYNCFYQDKHINKAKGSGVALYLKDELNGVVNEELSCVTKNLETLGIYYHST